MKVSIVIPIHNVFIYIENCLESVRRQIYQNLEVILVDNCGTDNSMETVQEYLKYHNFVEVKIIHHAYNRGLSAACNIGLGAATGSCVHFLGSDDALMEDCIFILVAPMRAQPYGFVVGSYEIKGSNKEYPALTLPSRALYGNKEILYSCTEGRWYMMAWSKLCNQKFLLDNKLFFEEGLSRGDVIWSFKLAYRTRSMYVIYELTYRYTIRVASIMTGTDIERDAYRYIKVFKVITQFVVNEGKQQA